MLHNEQKNFITEILGNDEEEFSSKLNQFYKSPPQIAPPQTNSLQDLLQSNFIVGEAHGCSASKEFLFKNMRTLKGAGFTTMFLEHLCYDNQHALDLYLTNNEPSIYGSKIQTKLGDLDFGWKLDKCAYNFTSLVRVAKVNGIRVVGIDTETTYREQLNHQKWTYGYPTGIIADNYRHESMHYTAYQIIQKEMVNHPNEKWCALFGNTHCCKVKSKNRSDESTPGVGVQGIADMTGARTILITEDMTLSNSQITYNNEWEVERSLDLYGDKKERVLLPYDIKIALPEKSLANQFLLFPAPRNMPKPPASPQTGCLLF